jgi:hypothetical protein
MIVILSASSMDQLNIEHGEVGVDAEVFECARDRAGSARCYRTSFFRDCTRRGWTSVRALSMRDAGEGDGSHANATVARGANLQCRSVDNAGVSACLRKLQGLFTT